MEQIILFVWLICLRTSTFSSLIIYFIDVTLFLKWQTKLNELHVCRTSELALNKDYQMLADLKWGKREKKKYLIYKHIYLTVSVATTKQIPSPPPKKKNAENKLGSLKLGRELCQLSCMQFSKCFLVSLIVLHNQTSLYIQVDVFLCTPEQHADY